MVAAAATETRLYIQQTVRVSGRKGDWVIVQMGDDTLPIKPGKVKVEGMTDGAVRSFWVDEKMCVPKIQKLEVADPEPTEKRKPTDDELGSQLIERWQGNYAVLYGAWHTYENGVWKVDEKRSAELAFWDVLIANKREGVKPNQGKASSVGKYCELRLTVYSDEHEKPMPYINLRNGLFNIETLKLEATQRDLYLTSQLDFDYEPHADCPVWLHFLATVLCNEDGQPDQELISLVQEAFYYSLTADTSFRVSFWLVGLSGTGKSTLVNTLVMLAGDSHTSIDLNALARDQYQFAEVAGKRLVTFSEPDSREPLADGAYKRLVSKDPITARSPYGKPFSFVPQCKVWGSMNDLPAVRDRSDAVFGRVIIIPMNRVIAEKDKDYTLDEKLRAERAGIFNWALRGAARLKKQGFTKARQSEDARKQYQLDNDTERLFLSERCRLGGEGFVFNDELYGAYTGWCKESGYYPKAKNVVGKDWRRLGLVQSKTGDGSKRIWKGVSLSTGSVDIPF